MTDAEQDPEVEQRLARELAQGRHRAPSEGVPQDLPYDGADDGHDGHDGHDGGAVPPT